MSDDEIFLDKTKRFYYETKFLPKLTTEQLNLICIAISDYGNLDRPIDKSMIKYFSSDFVFTCLIIIHRKSTSTIIKLLAKATIDQMTMNKKLYFQYGFRYKDLWVL